MVTFAELAAVALALPVLVGIAMRWELEGAEQDRRDIVVERAEIGDLVERMHRLMDVRMPR